MGRLLETIDTAGFAIIYSPPRNDPALIERAFSLGVDAVKVHCNVHHRASGNHFGTWLEERPTIATILDAASGPVGLMPGADEVLSREEFHDAIELGLDFIDIYDKHCPDWILDLPLTTMLALGHEHSPDDARDLEDLGVSAIEASIIAPADYGQALTIRDCELYCKLVRATKLPIIVPSQKKLTPASLVRLKRIGIRGVMLGTICLGSTLAELEERLPEFLDG